MLTLKGDLNVHVDTRFIKLVVPSRYWCPRCLSSSLLRRRRASSLIKRAKNLTWCCSKHSGNFACIRTVAALLFSLPSTPTDALASLSCTNGSASRCSLPPVSTKKVVTSSHTYVFCMLVLIAPAANTVPSDASVNRKHRQPRSEAPLTCQTSSATVARVALLISRASQFLEAISAAGLSSHRMQTAREQP